jgi:hypothetical protein
MRLQFKLELKLNFDIIFEIIEFELKFNKWFGETKHGLILKNKVSNTRSN